MFNPEPGKIAEVTIENVYHPGKAFYFQPKTSTFVGLIEEPMKWLDSEQFQMHAGKDARPGFQSRVIQKERIVELKYLDGSEAEQVEKPSELEYEQVVKGSKGNYYTVKCEDQKWSCTCPGFTFRQNCKHVKEAKDGV